MNLSENQFKTFCDHVEHRSQPVICSLCRATNWNKYKKVFALPAFRDEHQVNTFPVCVLTCGDCGNMLFIDAQRAGLNLNG